MYFSIKKFKLIVVTSDFVTFRNFTFFLLYYRFICKNVWFYNLKEQTVYFIIYTMKNNQINRRLID